MVSIVRPGGWRNVHVEVSMYRARLHNRAVNVTTQLVMCIRPFAHSLKIRERPKRSPLDCACLRLIRLTGRLRDPPGRLTPEHSRKPYKHPKHVPTPAGRPSQAETR